MTDTLTARLLAEIGRRETCTHCGHAVSEHVGAWCRVLTGAVKADGSERICCCEGASSDDSTLAYLAALRKIVDRHRERGGDCAECGDMTVFYPCPTIAAVAEGLGVAV